MILISSRSSLSCSFMMNMGPWLKKWHRPSSSWKVNEACKPRSCSKIVYCHRHCPSSPRGQLLIIHGSENMGRLSEVFELSAVWIWT